jgi:hypothetical protein
MRQASSRQPSIAKALSSAIEIKVKPLGMDAGNLLNEEVMKVIRHEYACKYLEMMNIEPNAKNVAMVLKTKPLSKCRVETGGTSSEVGVA